MARVCAFLATGLEEVECLSVVDLLRRAGVDVQLVSCSGEKVVTGSHNISIITDVLLGEVDFSDCDMIFLPGGVPGVPNLTANPLVARALRNQAAEGKRIAAICAAPSILGKMGMFAHQRFTCYPGWQNGIDGVDGARWTGAGVMTEGLITTGRGLGTAIDMGIELIRILADPATAEKIKAGIQHPDTF